MIAPRIWRPELGKPMYDRDRRYRFQASHARASGNHAIEYTEHFRSVGGLNDLRLHIAALVTAGERAPALL